MSIIRMVIYNQALTVQFDPDADFEYITTLTSYFSMLEAGLGLCAACLPVQYGLLRSKRVRDLLRTIYSLASFNSSRASHESARSNRTHRSARSGFSQNSRMPPLPNFGATNKTNESGSSESDLPLPMHAAHVASSKYTGEQQDVELGTMMGGHGILVTNSFETSQAAPEASHGR